MHVTALDIHYALPAHHIRVRPMRGIRLELPSHNVCREYLIVVFIICWRNRQWQHVNVLASGYLTVASPPTAAYKLHYQVRDHEEAAAKEHEETTHQGSWEKCITSMTVIKITPHWTMTTVVPKHDDK